MPVRKPVSEPDDRVAKARKAATETRPAIERGDYAAVIKRIQARFPRIRSRLAE